MHEINCKSAKARLIAFYLPQFHPIPENDEWWGKGFTEWRKVASAKPLYKNHIQPKIPGELGFYDLRVHETRIAQANLAKEYGIEGFCYWHYWFSGKQLLERPFNEVLNSNSLDFPFCLGWANVEWTGVWGGQPNKVLVKQDCSDRNDFIHHFNYLMKAFNDRRYIKVNGKPLLYIHYPYYIPESRRMLDLWRDLAVKNGFPGLYLVGNNIEADELTNLGYDAHSTHYPNWVMLSNRYSRSFIRKCYRKLFRRPAVFDYSKSVTEDFQKNYNNSENYHPLVVTNWDNTPRIGRKGVVLENSTPDNFRNHVKKVVETVKNKPEELKIIFLKSWNEWAEGNYIEPDLKYGRVYLEVLKEEVC
jgi:hypothetical protein